MPILISWLQEHLPDVLCLQETKVEDKDFPFQPFEEAGYHAAFFGQKRWNGVAFISKSPAEDVCQGLDSRDPSGEARMIRAVFSGVTILNTYIPQGRDVDNEQFSYKISWFERLGELLEGCYDKGQPIIWCGDLNHVPEARDVHDPVRLKGHVCYHPDVDRVFRRILDWGFTDVFRRHCQEEGQYSFFDYRVPNAVKRGLGWRIDHILATPALAEKSIACNIDLEPRFQPKPSDHTPVVAEFRL